MGIILSVLMWNSFSNYSFETSGYFNMCEQWSGIELNICSIVDVFWNWKLRSDRKIMPPTRHLLDWILWLSFDGNIGPWVKEKKYLIGSFCIIFSNPLSYLQREDTPTLDHEFSLGYFQFSAGGQFYHNFVECFCCWFGPTYDWVMKRVLLSFEANPETPCVICGLNSEFDNCLL